MEPDSLSLGLLEEKPSLVDTGMYADNREEIADLWVKILGVEAASVLSRNWAEVVRSMWMGTQDCSRLLLR
jgi:hypothetical protein